MAPATLTFVAPGARQPIGGATALYEFANAMSRLGHVVHLVHIDFIGNSRDAVVKLPDRVRSIDEISWCRFEQGIRHHFPDPFDEQALPHADFIFFFDERVPRHCGLPIVVIQGYRMLTDEFERRLYRSPCPKICVARWLVDVGVQLGVPRNQLVHVACAIEHRKYRVITPLEQRPPRVAMLYNSHPTKAVNVGLDALAQVKRRLPELDAVLFGTTEPVHPIPSWMTFLRSPGQDVIVGDIYNGSRVFLSSSNVEGFGLAPVEAMACGCALVTTANGGSADYAIHGETALVSAPGDATALADHIESLLVDDAFRVDLTRRGVDYSKRFDWDRSASAIDDFLREYGAAPDRYQ